MLKINSPDAMPSFSSRRPDRQLNALEATFYEARKLQRPHRVADVLHRILWPKS